MAQYSHNPPSKGKIGGARKPSPGLSPRGKGTAWLILAFALTITFWATHTARNTLEQVVRERFSFQVNEIRSAIEKRMQTYEQVLRGGVGLFNASDNVDRQEWRVYVESLRIEEHYPGILGIGYSRRLEPDQVEPHVQAVRDEGFPDYTVWPQGGRPLYTSIVYLEPFNWRNRRAFGYDMFSEPVRREAMIRARDSGRAAVSGRITLVQETDRDVQAGFLMYLPLYRSGQLLETPAQRREALRGWVYSPFRMDDLMSGILGQENQNLHLEIYDGRQVSADSAMYDSAPDLEAPPAHRYAFRERTVMSLDGHDWTLMIETLPGFGMDSTSRQPLLVLVGGLLISLLLFAVAWSLTTTRARALEMARQMTAAIQDREQELREITSSLGEGVYVQNRARRITFVNPEAQRLLGRSQEELLGRNASSLFTDVEGSPFLGNLFGALDQGRGFREEEALMLRQDGSRIIVSMTAEPIQRQGQVSGAVVSFRDLTLRKQAEKALRESQRFRLLFEYARDGLFLLESDGRVVDANRLACESLGFSRSELVSRQAAELTADLERITGGYNCKELFERVRQGERVVREGELKHRDGHRFPVEVVFSPIDYENRQLIMAAVRDTTERKQADEVLKRTMLRLEHARLDAENANRRLGQANAELRRLSQLDGLTGIANRRYLDEYLVQEWRRGNRSARPLSLVLADVDHFKTYNDRYGHQAGDDCLRRVVTAMGKAISRTTDLLARYGGEEFAVVLPETDRPGAEYLAERVRRAVESLDIPHQASTTADHVTLSLGVATVVPDTGQSWEDLVALADAALYRAKQQGRNRVYIHPEP